MISRRTNTFAPDRLHYANRTVDGRKIPPHLWGDFLTLWRTRGTGSALMGAYPGANRTFNRILAGTGIVVTVTASGGLQLTDTGAPPPVVHTGEPALEETREGPDEVPFSDLPRGVRV